MNALDKVVNWFTGRDLKTVLQPTTQIKDSVTLSTTKKKWNYHAYVLDYDKIDLADDGTLIAKLPKKSNIRDIEPILDKMNKRFKGEKMSKIDDEEVMTAWVDRYGRYDASKLEQPVGISYLLRCDIAAQMHNDGHVLVQCEGPICYGLLLTDISCNLKKFNAKDIDSLKTML